MKENLFNKNFDQGFELVETARDNDKKGYYYRQGKTFLLENKKAD
jgi:hypothetical protein